MNDLIAVQGLPEFDAAAYLDSPETIASYLSEIIREDNAGLLASALGDIARAEGMSEIAKKAGITREALYKALRENSSPRFDTINKVCKALGVRLSVVPIENVESEEDPLVHPIAVDPLCGPL